FSSVPPLLCRSVLFFLLIRHPPCSPLFPYTTLFRSLDVRVDAPQLVGSPFFQRRVDGRVDPEQKGLLLRQRDRSRLVDRPGVHEDRKSTRLNSSHVKISYAVFCLKKKKTSTA